jgi:hypothetical protein
MLRKKTPSIPLEATEDMNFYAWCMEMSETNSDLELIYHIANEKAWKLGKKGGIVRGVSDWHLPVPSRGYSSLWLEMKRQKGGRVRPEQVEWLRRMEELGAYTCVAQGAQEAILAVSFYLDLPAVPHLLRVRQHRAPNGTF